jgi:hypothetical protein
MVLSFFSDQRPGWRRLWPWQQACHRITGDASWLVCDGAE